MKVNEFQSGSKVVQKITTSQKILDEAKEATQKESNNKKIVLKKDSTQREMISNYSEWYFKMGKAHENIKDYKQAISAYEKAYSAKPDIKAALSVDHARKRAF